MNDILLEPLKAYKEVYKNAFEENMDAYLNELVKSSGVDADANRNTVERYRQASAVFQDSGKRLSRLKGLRVMLIVLTVIALIGAAISVMVIVDTGSVGAICTLVGLLAIAISFILIVVLVLKPRIKTVKEENEKHAKEAEQIKRDAWLQMLPLNGAFDSKITKELIEKTVPKLQIDDRFEMRRYDYLRGKYGFGMNDANDCSTLEILSGEILGNPFVVDRELVHTVGNETYQGTLVITWTTYSTDSKGHRRAHVHSQTLVASVTKPKPYYSERTRLIYVNEAAPDLCFTHTPSHAERLDEKDAAREVRSGVKRIRKMQEDALEEGRNFTAMGNEEFDVFFGAFDRNHEVQFRLLFTPLAQKNMIELMRSDQGFGDDFYFEKEGCLNYISSEHSANWDLDTSYTRYASYDLEQIKNNFRSFNRAYFRSLYFELAPLLAIPLYQQHKPKEYIYEEVYGRNYTDYEAERAVNAFGAKHFVHPQTQTPAILKTQFLNKDGESDALEVDAYSYRTVEHVEYVSVFGGDGRTHAVPVPWTEYIPVKRTSRVMLKKMEFSDKEFQAKSAENKFAETLKKYGACHYSRGLLCCLLGRDGEDFEEDLRAVIEEEK